MIPANDRERPVYDVVVAGGGIVGLAFLRLLSNAAGRRAAPLRMALLESSPPASKRNVADVLRVSAVAPAVGDILTAAGIWQHLSDADCCPYREMHVWYAGDDVHQSLQFSAAELGVPALGYIVRNAALRRIGWDAVVESPAIDVIAGAAPAALNHSAAGWDIQLADGSLCQARLLVAADGARSAVRDLLQIKTQRTDYEQHAIVAEIAPQRHHEAIARQRFLPGGPLALLPLANGNCSLVWSSPREDVDALLALDDREFAARLSSATGYALGELQCVSERLSFPLVSSHAASYVERRCALLGDAAHQVHPLAGQGLNLGLLDAAELVKCLAAHMQAQAADPGDRRVLRAYERARKGDNLITQYVLSSLNSLFNSELASVAGSGMALLDRAGPVKKLLARYAMGEMRGDLAGKSM